MTGKIGKIFLQKIHLKFARLQDQVLTVFIILKGPFSFQHRLPQTLCIFNKYLSLKFERKISV